MRTAAHKVVKEKSWCEQNKGKEWENGENLYRLTKPSGGLHRANELAGRSFPKFLLVKTIHACPSCVQLL
jgi:hypothetical protein